MPNTILKRWNGSAFEELYPKTITSQISASGTPSASTFLRGDGQWAVPATQSHNHGNIQNGGTMGGSTLNPGSGVNILVSGSDNTIGKSTIAFSGSGTGFLKQDGTWAAPTGGTPTQVVNTVSGTNSAELVRGNMADNDQFRILVGGTASNAGYAEIATADDGTEPIHVRQYTGVFSSLVRTATLLDDSGNTSFPGTVTAPTFSGSLSGNATSASSVAWGNVSSKPSNIMYYQGFTLDANTMDSNATGFTYSNNAPSTGPVVRFSTGSAYDLWLNAPYTGGSDLYFRTRNGDLGTINAWRKVWNEANDGSGSGLDADLLDGNHASAFASSSHTHGAGDITSGTLVLARGGTGTTSVTAGGVVFGQTGSSAYTNTSAPTSTTQYLGASFNGNNNFPVWNSPSDSSTRTILSSSSTALSTERDVYWGTRYIHLGVTTVAGQNVSRTISFTSGMKNFILQLHQDTTTGAVIARLPLTISNSGGTSTDAQIYSLDTTTVTHRISWSNGSVTNILNVSISYSGTTITVSQSFNFNCAFRLFGF